jgi:uncharacterized protein YndB with AHSA1/START domain
MKWVLIVVAGLVGIVALVAIVGSLLPKGHVARRTAHYTQTPDSVWAAIADVPGQASWRTDLKSVERAEDRNGKQVWRETSKRGDVVPYETTEIIPPRRLVRTIADPDLPYGGRWIYEVAAEPTGARLTITEEGLVYNPIFRFVSHYFLDMGATIEGYMKALGTRFTETPTIDKT